MITYTISKNSINGHCFPTITDALRALPKTLEPAVLQIQPGTYHEKITIDRPYVTLLGTNPETTIISYDDYAYAQMEDGTKRGTFRSYTLFLDSHHITLEGITIQNSASPRSKVGQCIALYADGDVITVKNCRLISYQDTLFVGPLPPYPLSPGGFTGPKEFAKRLNGRQLYENCYICGDIDFIFGSGTAYFNHCEIASVYSEELLPTEPNKPPTYGYITAASTPLGQDFGFIFYDCNFTSTCPKHSVYLGRPWRNHAKTVFLYCTFGEHIHPAGFHDWGKKEAHHTLFYAEYHCKGPGAVRSSRASFCQVLTDEASKFYSQSNVLGDFN